jgi:phytoene dehydrogenase-like protein
MLLLSLFNVCSVLNDDLGTPYEYFTTEERKKAFGEHVLKVIDGYCPGFAKYVLHMDILTPPDLEREFGLTGGILRLY